MTISERLQKLRKENNLSQEDLAEKLNISRQAISKWESGQGKPDIDNIIKLCKIYNISSDYILLGKEDIKDNSNTTIVNNDIIDKTNSIIQIIITVGIVLLFLIGGIFWLISK